MKYGVMENEPHENSLASIKAWNLSKLMVYSTTLRDEFEKQKSILFLTELYGRAESAGQEKVVNINPSLTIVQCKCFFFFFLLKDLLNEYEIYGVVQRDGEKEFSFWFAVIFIADKSS